MAFETLYTLLRGDPVGGFSVKWLQSMTEKDFERFVIRQFETPSFWTHTLRPVIFRICRQARDIHSALKNAPDDRKSDILSTRLQSLLNGTQNEGFGYRSSYTWLALGLQDLPGLRICQDELKRVATSMEGSFWSLPFFSGLSPEEGREAFHKCLQRIKEGRNSTPRDLFDPLILTAAWTLGLEQAGLDANTACDMTEQWFQRTCDYRYLPAHFSAVALTLEGRKGLDQAVPQITRHLEESIPWQDTESDPRFSALLDVLVLSGHRFGDGTANALLKWMLSKPVILKRVLNDPSASFLMDVSEQSGTSSQQAVADFVASLRAPGYTPEDVRKAKLYMMVAFLALNEQRHGALNCLLERVKEHPYFGGEQKREWLSNMALIIGEIQANSGIGAPQKGIQLGAEQGSTAIRREGSLRAPS